MTANPMNPIPSPKIPLGYKAASWPFRLRPEHLAELESLIAKLAAEEQLAVIVDT
jgi:hypothetical protein